MTRGMFLVGGALLLRLLAAEQARAAMTTVELHNAQGESVGTATLEAMPDGVKLVLQAAQLAPGQHGLHIHAVGKCAPLTLPQPAATLIPTANTTGWRTLRAPMPATCRISWWGRTARPPRKYWPPGSLWKPQGRIRSSSRRGPRSSFMLTPMTKKLTRPAMRERGSLAASSPNRATTGGKNGAKSLRCRGVPFAA